MAKNLKIQPIEFILGNNLGFAEGCIVKYISRWKDKGGIQDLRKVIHYAEFLIEHEANLQSVVPSGPAVPMDPEVVAILAPERQAAVERVRQKEEALVKRLGWDPLNSRAYEETVVVAPEPTQAEQLTLFEDPWGTGDASEEAAAYYPKLTPQLGIKGCTLSVGDYTTPVGMASPKGPGAKTTCEGTIFHVGGYRDWSVENEPSVYNPEATHTLR
jgi:hypothetical protein